MPPTCDFGLKYSCKTFDRLIFVLPREFKHFKKKRLLILSNFTKLKNFSELNYTRISLKSIKITKLYTYFEYFFKKTEFLYQKFKVDFKGKFRTKMPISPVVSYSVELWFMKVSFKWSQWKFNTFNKYLIF